MFDKPSSLKFFLATEAIWPAPSRVVTFADGFPRARYEVEIPREVPISNMAPGL
jgi:hypothetical protein